MSEVNLGWIKLHRAALNSEWFTEPNTHHLFIYCLLRANHSDTRVRGIKISRGEFLTSLPTLSRETGLTTMQVRTSLKKLILSQNVTDKITNKYRLISVVNYDKYQADNRQVTDKQQTDNRQVTADNKVKNIKEEEGEKKNALKKEFSDLILEGEFYSVLVREKFKDGDAAINCFKKWKTHRLARKRLPDNFLSDWELWVLSERVPAEIKHEEAGELTPEEKEINILGMLKWKIKMEKKGSGFHVSDLEKKRVLDYEKLNGEVWWDNLEQYNKAQGVKLVHTEVNKAKTMGG